MIEWKVLRQKVYFWELKKKAKYNKKQGKNKRFRKIFVFSTTCQIIFKLAILYVLYAHSVKPLNSWINSDYLFKFKTHKYIFNHEYVCSFGVQRLLQLMKQ